MKILVAYDGSAHADKALIEAIDMAKKFSGSITALHVCWEESDQESQKILSIAQDRLMDTGVKYYIRSERSRFIPRRITRIARDEGFDLITIGCRGFDFAKAWVMGSVSSRVIEEAICPVLVVR